MTEVLAAAGVLREGVIGPGWIAFDDGRVTGTGWGSAPRGARDLGDVILAPGFVDIQVNGCGTVDFLRAHGDEWSVAGRALADAGTTSYLATLCSSPRERYADALARVDAARRHAEGARIDGVHLEGPFLGGAPGAHPRALLGPADPAWMDALMAGHPGLVRLVTLAPEADPGGAATRALVAAGVRVALGHSTCSVEAARAAADAGACAVVLECIPRAVAATITKTLPIPTIGIGAGPDCDGQVLVMHDLVGLSPDRVPKFVRQYADAKSTIAEALARWRADVKRRTFPGAEETLG